MTEPKNPTRLVNLTSEDIVIYTKSKQLVVTLRSSGELRTIERDGPRFIDHHVHHYDPTTNDEAGVPVLSVQGPVCLDQTSPGYHIFDNLSIHDCIIVSPMVASFLSDNNIQCNATDVFTVGEDSSLTVVSEDNDIIGYTGLKWYPITYYQ